MKGVFMPNPRKAPDTAPLVIVTISGGVGDILFKSPGARVAIYDYDVEGCDEADIDRDPDNETCVIREWAPGEEIVSHKHWPAIRKAMQARRQSYSRQWKCPNCSRTIEHSYEALAEVGTPICSDCDIEMEMI